MTEIAEIKSAIEKLPLAKLEQLAAWLDEYRQTLNAADAVFCGYDEEEKR